MPGALVVPGLIAIDPARWDGAGPAEVTLGPLAGWAQRLDLADWKTERWYLPRAVAERRGVTLPERRLDLSSCPALAAVLGEAKLVRVDEAVGAKAVAAQDDALVLAYHRGAGGGGVTVHRGGVVRGVSAEDGPLARAAAGPTGADDDEDDEDGPELDVSLLYDRLLRVLSGGAWSLMDVDLAERAARLDPSTLPSAARALAELAAHAEAHREEGHTLVVALASATTDSVVTPSGRRFTRRHDPGFTLCADGDVQLLGDPIVVPPQTRWIAEDVTPLLLAERIAQRTRRGAAPAARRGPWALFALIITALLLGWLLRGA